MDVKFKLAETETQRLNKLGQKVFCLDLMGKVRDRPVVAAIGGV